LVFEIFADYLLQHHSETYVRVSRQYTEAVKASPARPGEPVSILIVGNSLLLFGIQVDRLQELTSRRLRIYPVFLEYTGYSDWLYGLQRLFRQGSRPQVVIVGVGVNRFVLENRVRPEYAPMMLFDVRDLLDAASDLKLDRTAISNLLLAHASAFWNTRSVIRSHVLLHIVPHSNDLFALKTLAAVPEGPELEGITIARIESLRQLCAAYGAKLIILLPPTPYSEHAVRRMVIASEKIGVATLAPIDPAALPERFYQPDAIHLNSEGAALFTSSLATLLRSLSPL